MTSSSSSRTFFGFLEWPAGGSGSTSSYSGSSSGFSFNNQAAFNSQYGSWSCANLTRYSLPHTEDCGSTIHTPSSSRVLQITSSSNAGNRIVILPFFILTCWGTWWSPHIIANVSTLSAASGSLSVIFAERTLYTGLSPLDALTPVHRIVAKSPTFKPRGPFALPTFM